MKEKTNNYYPTDKDIENHRKDFEWLLSEYILVDEKVKIFPLFIESYKYEYKGKWKDETINYENKKPGTLLQRNRKKMLYVHLNKNKRKNGIDFVLSNNENVAFSVLIKYARVGVDNSSYYCSMSYLPELIAEKLNLSVKEFAKEFNAKELTNGHSLKLIKDENTSNDPIIHCKRTGVKQKALYKDLLLASFKQNLGDLELYDAFKRCKEADAKENQNAVIYKIERKKSK